MFYEEPLQLLVLESGGKLPDMTSMMRNVIGIIHQRDELSVLGEALAFLRRGLTEIEFLLMCNALKAIAGLTPFLSAVAACYIGLIPFLGLLLSWLTAFSIFRRVLRFGFAPPSAIMLICMLLTSR